MADGRRLVDRVEQTSNRLAKAEDNAIARINSAMSRRFSRLEKELRSSWSDYQQQSRLPQQKAIALSRELDKYLNLANISPDKDLRTLFNRARNEGESLAKDLLSRSDNTKNLTSDPIPLNSFVDFWATDSSNRLNDWGSSFQRDATAIFELGLSQNWDLNRLMSALRSRFGKLQFEAERIIKTASVSVANDVLSAYYQANKIKLVQLISQGDDRVCPYCASRAGNIYYLKDIKLPFHPHERCFLVPVKRTDLRDGVFDKKFFQQYKQEGLDLLREAGRRPNASATPFERKAGRTDAPVPVWTPEKGFRYGEASKTRRSI